MGNEQKRTRPPCCAVPQHRNGLLISGRPVLAFRLLSAALLTITGQRRQVRTLPASSWLDCSSATSYQSALSDPTCEQETERENLEKP